MTVYLKGEGNKKKYLSGHDVPQVSDLFIDKLYMTLPIPKNQQMQVESKFEEAINCGIGYKCYTGGYYKSLKLTSSLIDEGTVIIQCTPKNPKLNFFRIEFTPSLVDLSILKKDLDNLLPGGYQHLIDAGKVNRIDLTVDASYLDATDIIVTHKKMKTEKLFAKNGAIESKYLGAAGSKKQFLLYDKVKEIKEKNKKKLKGFKAMVPGHSLFRIECRLLKLACPLNEIVNLPNPFTDLFPTAYPGAKATKEYDPLWPLFLCACRFEGVDNAVAYLNAADKATFTKRLEEKGKKDWWNPEKIWKGLASAINVITNVNGISPLIAQIT